MHALGAAAMLRALVNRFFSPRCRLVALAVLLMWAAPLEAQAPATSASPDRAFTSAPSIAIGLASQVVFLGGEVLYYVQLPSPRWHMAVHVGAGGFPADNEGGRSWGMAGGTFVAFGKHHRMVVGLEAGTRAWETFGLHGETLARRQTPGAGLTLGWEWMSSFGLFVRGSLGPAFSVQRQTPLFERCVNWGIAGGWVVGYKLW